MTPFLVSLSPDKLQANDQRQELKSSTLSSLINMPGAASGTFKGPPAEDKELSTQLPGAGLGRKKANPSPELLGPFHPPDLREEGELPARSLASHCVVCDSPGAQRRAPSDSP